MPEPPQGADDPHKVWQVFKSVFKNLSSSRAVSQELQYLTSLTQIVSEYPQALVATSAWPDIGERGRRREAVTSALVRRLLHCQAARAEVSQTMSATEELLKLIISVLHKHSLTRWRVLISSMVDLWHRLAVASDKLQGEEEEEDVEGLTISEMGAAVRLLPPAEEEDEEFPIDMNILVLSCPDAVETLQVCLTNVMRVQQATLSSYLPLILRKVQTVALLQLGGGESTLKASTLDLLSAFHSTSGPGALDLWAEEAAWLGQVVLFMTSPIIGLVTERQMLGQALSNYASTLVSRWSRGCEGKKDELVLMAAHFLSHWLSLVKQKLTSRLEVAEEPFELVAALLVGYCDEKEESKVLDCLLASDKVQLTVVAVELAWNEIRKSGIFETGSREMRGKRRLGGQVEVASLCLVSPIWTRLLVQLDNKLETPLGLATFCKVVQSLLKSLAGGFQMRNMQLIEKNHLVRVTDFLISKVCNHDNSSDDMSSLLDVMETLLLIGHFWPGAEHIGSEIGVLQQTWAALLSLPWLSGHDLRDLSLEREADLRQGADLTARAWDEETKDRALFLLLSLPPWACPKWRTSVARAAWTSRSKGLVKALPLISRMGSSITGFSHQVVTAIVEERKETGLVKVLAAVAPIFLCSLAKTVEIRMQIEGGKPTLYPVCSTCSLPGPGSITPNKGCKISSREVEPLLKLLGFFDPEVRVQMVKIMRGFTQHCSPVSEAAVALWVQCARDGDRRVRMAFAVSVENLLNCKTDTLSSRDHVSRMLVERLVELNSTITVSQLDSYLATLVQVSEGSLPKDASNQLNDCLLSLFFNSPTNVTTYARALESLKKALITDKSRVMFWCAKAMCREGQDPRPAIHWLKLLCPKESSPNKFLADNLHRLLPAVTFHCAMAPTSSTASLPLKVLADFTEAKVRTLLVDHFPVIFVHQAISSENSRALKRCLDFVNQHTGVDLGGMIKANRQRILTELLSFYNSHKTRITLALSMCASTDQNFKKVANQGGDSKGLPSKEVARYVGECLMAALSTFNVKLGNKEVSSEDKLMILKSLNELILFLGHENLVMRKHALLESIKMATSLCQTDSMPQMRDTCVNLWDSFVHSMAPSSLVDLLPQILVGLLPHLDMNPSKTAAIYQFLLKENAPSFKGQEVPYIMLLEDRDINDLKDIVKVARGQNLSFEYHLARLLKFVDHECVEVRHQTLKTLSSLLDGNVSQLQTLILGTDRSNPVVTGLVQSLLACTSCREPDQDVRMLAAVCLGKLGAIDPGRLEFDHGVAAEDVGSVLDLFSTSFCSNLLQELVRAQASTKEPFLAETFAFSIQEVLKVYEINLSDDHSSFTWTVWRNLADATQEALAPLLDSKYSYENSCKVPSAMFPVYGASGSTGGANYRDWLVNWSGQLVGMVKEVKVHSLFMACQPASRRDLRVAEFLLPFLVLAVLTQGTEKDVAAVRFEVEAILPGEKKEEVDFNLQQLVAQALFNVLDHIAKWLRLKLQTILAQTRKGESKLTSDEIKAAKNKSPEYLRVANFQADLERLSFGIGNLAFLTGDYHRSAFHLDAAYREGLREGGLTMKELSSLQRLYGSLGDPDLIGGLGAAREEEPGLPDLIQQHEATGNYQDALSCYEKLEESDMSEVESLAGQVRCYLNIDQPVTAASLAAGLVAQDQLLARELAPLQAEAAWQLSRWDDLEIYTRDEDTSGGGFSSWEVGLGRVLGAVRRKDWVAFETHLKIVRGDVLGTISSGKAERGAYTRSYLNVARLSMLHEVEHFTKLFITSPKKEVRDDAVASKLLDELSLRLDCSQQSWTSLAPLLRVRRALLGLSAAHLESTGSHKVAERLRYEIGESWLRSAEAARSSGQLQEAYTLILQVKKHKNVQFFLEASQLAWDRGQQTEAISALKKGLKEAFPTMQSAWEAGDEEAIKVVSSRLDKEEKGPCQRGKLLLAKYLNDSASVTPSVIAKHYLQACRLDPRNAEALFQYASHTDSILIAQETDEGVPIGFGETVREVLKVYIKATQVGAQHLHHCMPRIISLWLDFSANLQKHKERKNKDMKQCAALDVDLKVLEKCVEMLKDWTKSIPSYYLLTAAPQLVSRICHPVEDTWHLLRTMIVKLLVSFPQQGFWHLVAVNKSRDSKRRDRYTQIINEACSHNPRLKDFFDHGTSLCGEIDKLCLATVNKGTREMSLKGEARPLHLLVNNSNLNKSSIPVILPDERNMIASLPSHGASHNSHNPFPGGTVAIAGIEDQVLVMSSLVQPKKITFRGSDGKLYPFLAKPKDDLRRDCRLMDFCAVLNKLFRSDPESRKRGLSIRTYRVVPTNETNGLIEWLPNLTGIRPIIHEHLRERGLRIDSRWMARFTPKKEDKIETKRKMLALILKELKGPVLANWFAASFPDPQAWLMARLAFTRSTGVMSMVGYIIGLGDRHLENINIDTTSGKSVHVDMNSLFNKGETMEIPEVVPFRLTGNMVDAMGPLGVDGPFRISCEVALGLMRKEKEVLMSMLRPFIFDPLMDWTKGARVAGGTESTAEGRECLRRVQERLTGTETVISIRERLEAKKKGKNNEKSLQQPLSVVGHVARLTEQARDFDNLACMYWGWAPYF